MPFLLLSRRHSDAVAWSPDGALIAVGQTDATRGGRLQVSFFETNGLRHRELVLRFVRKRAPMFYDD